MNFLNFNEFTLNTKDSKKFSDLQKYGIDITLLAKNGDFNNYCDRNNEINTIIEALICRKKNNILLVGEAGIGKKSIIKLLALKIIQNLVPTALLNYQIIEINLYKLLLEFESRTEIETHFNNILKEAQDRKIILFINDIHNILKNSNNTIETKFNSLHYLEPILLNSNIKCIGTTLPSEFTTFKNNLNVSNNFQAITILEPSALETFRILYNLRPSLEIFYNVEITTHALRSAIELSTRYIFDKFLPNKAIELLDLAAAKEIVLENKKKDVSIIKLLITTSLKNLNALRLEAFRRGDIASEFIFYEIENTYHFFILKWLENSSLLNLNFNTFLTPVSSFLITQLKLTIIKYINYYIKNNTNISITSHTSDTQKIIKENILKNYYILIKLLSKNILCKLTFTKISTLIFIEWIKNTSNNFKNIIYYYFHLYKFYNITKTKISDNTLLLNSSNKINTIEEQKIQIFLNYLENLKPLLEKGLLESLNLNSYLNISQKEIQIIYDLLGHYSLTKGWLFLKNNQNMMYKLSYKTANKNILKLQITPKNIQELIAQITNLPLQSITAKESQNLGNLEMILHQYIIGQEAAIKAISRTIRRVRLGLQTPNRPLSSFLFCGPTGVGKTEVTKALATIMFGSEKELIRFDMSEFMEKFTVSRLVGSPPGYIGYEEGGQLTNEVRAKPYAILLLDEIEKAHPSIFNILLQILDDGRLTDTKKNLVSFENIIIILTSNIAAKEIQSILNVQKASTISTLANQNNLLKNNSSQVTLNTYFLQNLKHYIYSELQNTFKKLTIPTQKIKIKNKAATNSSVMKNLKKVVLKRLTTVFLPEFLNRLDDIIIFQPLKPEELLKICEIMVKNLINRLRKKNLFIIVTDQVKIKLANEGYNPIFGARPLRRLITKHIEDLISNYLLTNSYQKNNIKHIKIILDKQNKITIL